MEAQITCKNCGHTFQGEYCNQCGQKVFKRLTRSFLWQGLHQDLLNVDSGLLLTFKELWTHPGAMVLNYVQGKTKQYYSPLRYLFFWTALYLLVITFTSNVVPWNSLTVLITNSNAPFTAKSFDDFITFLFPLMTTHTDVYILGILPFLSSVNYLFHRANQFNLIEILVLHTYFLSQFVFAMILLTTLSPWINSYSITFFGRQLSDYLSVPPYFYLFFKMQKEFFSETWRVAIFRGLAVWVLGTLSFWICLFIFFNGIKYVL